MPQNAPNPIDSSTSLHSGRNDNRKGGRILRSSDLSAEALAKAEGAKHGWSPERRARQSAMMHANQIWLKSTGPKTKAGKARSSQNALKPWLKNNPDRVMNKALRAQTHYLTEIKRFIALKKIYWKNELLKREIRNRKRRLQKLGRKVTFDLMVASTYVRLCGRLRNGSPLQTGITL